MIQLLGDFFALGLPPLFVDAGHTVRQPRAAVACPVAPVVPSTRPQPSLPVWLGVAGGLWIRTGAGRYSPCTGAGALMGQDCSQRLTPFERPGRLLTRNLMR